MTDHRQPTMHDSHAPAAVHPPAAGGHDAHAAHHPHANYLAIFVALCICTMLSAIFDILPLNRRMIAALVLAVAVAKAQYVMRYFMHLKFEGKWKYVVLLPTAILACGMLLALAPDHALHYYAQEIPQIHQESTARGGHDAPAAHDETPHTDPGHDAAADHADH